ncbi:MAG TPA: hypothetical protein VNO50_08335 [Pyrinomonadaceae bacterium]|nr:hypothetical protein [Pyrinomonadaceae bacterium]
MRKRLLTITLATLAISIVNLSAMGNAQIPANVSSAAQVAQQHLIGEVTAIDPTANLITIKTDAGGSVIVAVNADTKYRRLPPGQNNLATSETITSADVKVGDRVLVPGGVSLAGGAAARQVIVMAREAVAARREQQRDDWRTRGVNGRVVAIDPAKKEITIESRSREGVQSLTVVTGANTRVRRYAPGSIRPDDAVAGTFADIRVGDQLRALGNREESRMTAEEVISGSVTRMMGTVEKIDTSRNEVVVKDSQSGKSIIVALLPKTTLRRVPADFAETLERMQQRRGDNENLTEAQRAAQREQRAARRRERGNQGTPAAGTPAGEARPGARPGGRNPQQMMENFPVITVNDLKKGDAVMIAATGTNDAARLTAATLVTGDAEIIQILQRRAGGRPEGMSPGLPSGVMGGGTGSEPERQQPATPPQ